MSAHDLADAVVSALADFASDAVAVRRCRIVTTDVATISGTVVSVIPYSVGRKFDAFGIVNRDTEIRIVVQTKITGTSEATDKIEEDAAAKLSEDIAEFLLGETLLFSECMTAELSPSYEAGYLADIGLFDATIRTTWGAVIDGD